MESQTIYKDIAERTNGDIYVGVVGPVRVGKSTFICRFMEEFVVPRIANKNTRACAIDELPQSADGLQIMTTQPKFVSAESVKVQLPGGISMNLKMIDCVGYFVPGATGHEEDNKPRMVKTPWSKNPMPFEQAAELGTRKVVSEHSTIAVLMTTDGSFGDLPRDSFIPIENRLVSELREYHRPFVMVVNSKNPKAESTKELVKSLQQKHKVGVVALNATEMGEKEVSEVFEKVLDEFPLVGIELSMPSWLTALEFENPIITEISAELKRIGEGVEKIGQFDKGGVLFELSQRFEPLVLSEVAMGQGKIKFDLMPKEGLFYEVLSKECGIEIKDDFALVANMCELAKAKQQFDKLEHALAQVRENGYGVVLPTVAEMTLEEPELVRQGANRFGVKIRASAPSLHIMRVDLETEINPLVGSEQQSQDLVNYLSQQSQENPNGIWDTNMFGKTISQLMSEGLSTKLNAMPVEAQRKMRKTLTRIVNEGKGGIICILL